MRTINNKTLMSAAFGFAAAAGLVIALLLVRHKDAVFWITLAFTFSAVGGVYLAILYAARGPSRNISADFSLVSVGICYLAAELIIMIVFGNVIRLDAVGYFCIQLAVLAVAAFIMIFMVISKRKIIRLDRDTQAGVLEIRALCATVGQMKRTASALPFPANERALCLLDELEEHIRYADPMTHKSLNDFSVLLNERLEMLAQELVNAVDITSGDMTSVEENIADIDRLLAERDGLLSALKAR